MKNKIVVIVAIVLGAIVLTTLIVVLVKGTGKKPAVTPGQGEEFATTATRKPVPEGVRIPEVGEKVEDKDVAVPTVTTAAAPGVAAKLRAFSLRADRGRFEPSKIIVNKGDTVNIVIEAVDKEYDFTIPDFGIKQIIPKGAKKVVEFQASNEGQFTYYCEACGGMDSPSEGVIVVAP